MTHLQLPAICSLNQPFSMCIHMIHAYSPIVVAVAHA
jgi:hypothetical protein